MADSLDYLQMQQLQQQEQWEAELRQLQAEVVRLRRLCKNQVSGPLVCVCVRLYHTVLDSCVTACVCLLRDHRTS